MGIIFSILFIGSLYFGVSKSATLFDGAAEAKIDSLSAT